ncbi:PAS domain S-box protein [Marichromatium bheemlicum]|uniref:histidine kinase n=1 Tax=Marichromatium bheemlicum TaxID=365339 RepID=A0ABX1I938_9GAMM|nr:PAS domain S-box protein [Marichromatium bheemlicum]NKN33469.1 PAS domain S-box protein [Marichromatium bheemlicum]
MSGRAEGAGPTEVDGGRADWRLFGGADVVVLRGYLISGLVVLALLQTAAFWTVSLELRQLEDASRVVNLSGRQRMLVTRVDALMTRLVLLDDPHQRRQLHALLGVDLDQLERVHHGLLAGAAELRLDPVESRAVHAIYADSPYRLDEAMGRYLTRVRALLAEGGEEIAAALPGLWAQRDEVVRGLEVLTKQFEREAAIEVRVLEWVVALLVAALLLCLVGVWYFSFRPLERRIMRERELLRGVTEQVADGIVTVDGAGRVRSANPAAAALFGCTPDALLGQALQTLIPGAPIDGVARCYEIEGRRGDGSTLPLEVSVSAMHAAGLRLSICVVRDVSARQRAAQALRLERARLETFVRHTPAAVAMFDDEMRYLLCSERWRIDYGLGDRPLLGVSHYQIFPEIPARWRAIHQRCLTGQVERCEEDPFTRADGSIDWVRWEIHPWFDGERVGGIIMFTEVITQRKRAEAALNLRDRAIEAASCGILIADAVDADNPLIYVNPEFERISGYRASEVIGRNCRLLQAGDCDQPGVRVLRAALAEQRAATVLLRNYRKDGSLFWNQTSIAPVFDTGGALTHFVGIITDVTERIRAEEALRESRERYRSLYNDTPVMLSSIDAEGALVAVSDYWLRKLGYTREAVVGRALVTFLTEASAHVHTQQVLPMLLRQGRCEEVSYTLRCADGATMEVELSAIADVDADGRLIRALAVMNDVTDKKRTEEELRQAQKLEAVGQLTGGIAHDFNNLLAVVMGNLQLLERRVEGPARALANVRNALEASARGVELTRRLLAFARRQPLTPQRIDVNALISGMRDLLQRTLSSQIEIELRLCESVAPVMVDPTQLESALLNLAINARDAMPEGGRLLIESADVVLDATDAAAHPQLAAGAFVMIRVTDTGVGIPYELQGRIFEPFFTTKAAGHGTGLGLSMLYGFVRQSMGALRVDSEPGQGAAFELYLPQAQTAGGGAAAPHTTEVSAVVRRGQGECILLVEDDALVRETSRMRLETLGYRVIEAEDGEQALARLRERPEITLLFSDVVMPGGFSGPELAARARVLRPGLPVLLTSGYPRDHLAGALETEAFIPKPCSEHALAEALSGLLVEVGGDGAIQPINAVKDGAR